MTARTLPAGLLALLAPLATSACKPNLDQTVSIVSHTQILAISADPAEAPPKAEVHYEALVVDSSGLSQSAFGWAFCSEREPLAELGPVSPKCYQASGNWFSPFGVGPHVTGTIPTLACRQFGPEVPEPQANQPPGRPVDPDATGGYYQPVRVLVPGNSGDVIGVAETRLTCGLAGTPDQVTQFAHHSIPNVNPAIDSLTAGGVSFSTNDGGMTNVVGPGQSLVLEAAWARCPLPTGQCGDGVCELSETATSCPADCMNLAGCTGAETYVNLDLATRALVSEREGMQVSFFATGGVFDNDQTGRNPSEAENFADNGWKAPEQPGIIRMWLVLRDDRGGVGWAEYDFEVR